MPSSKLGDHRLAAARIAAHRVDGDGIVRRHQARIDQRPQQRNAAGRIAAGIGDLPRGADLVGLVRRELRKAVGPVAARRETRSTRRAPWAPRLPMLSISATVSFAASSGRQRMTRSTSSISARLAAASLRFSCGDAFHRDVALQPRRSLNAEPRRSGLAVNEHGGLRRGDADGLGLLAVGEGHGTFLSSWFVSLAKAAWFANALGRASLIKCAICCAPASACAASDPAIAA